MTETVSAKRRRGPAPGTPRGPRMPRAQREAQLVGVAVDLFSQNGYAGTTMEGVAEVAGITKPVIYDLFGSKEGLLQACFSQARAELTETLRQTWRAMPKGTSLEGYYRGGLLAFFEYMDDNASTWRVIVADQTLFGSGPIADFRNAQARTVAEALRHQASFAAVPEVYLDGAVQVIMGACERIAAWRLAHPEMTAAAATELVATITWGGLSELVALRVAAPARSGTSNRWGLASGL